MKKNIFWKLRESLTGSYTIRQSIKQVLAKQKEKNEELFAFSLIKPYLGNHYFPLTGYVLSPLLIQKLLNEISLNNASNILEFGAGFSTVVISNFILKHNLPIQFTSVENSQEYMDYVKSHIIDANDSRLRFVVAPLCEKNKYHEATTWYDVNAVKNSFGNKPYDLILVDGPYGKLQKNIRHGFLDVCENHYNEHTTFYIDDSHRPDERAIVNFLKEKYKMQDIQYMNTTRLFTGNKLMV
ncbi:MAG: class I SAM-dependent methyltransferase [Chitinophagaceae bacterium]